LVLLAATLVRGGTELLLVADHQQLIPLRPLLHVSWLYPWLLLAGTISLIAVPVAVLWATAPHLLQFG